MSRKSKKHQIHKKKSKEEPAKKLFFLERRIFSTSIFIVVLLGAFLGITQLNQSDATLTGEAQKMILQGSSEPYFKLYDSYSKYLAEKGEKATIGSFNDLLYRSNILFIDSSKNYAQDRLSLNNKPSEMRTFTNKVYAKVDLAILDIVAWWMVFEDNLKQKTLALKMTDPNWQNKPLADAVWNRISGREPQITTKAMSKSAFIDCVDRMSKTYSLPDKSISNMIELSELGACLQSGIENENLFWNPFVMVDPSNWQSTGSVDIITPGGDPPGTKVYIITP